MLRSDFTEIYSHKNTDAYEILPCKVAWVATERLHYSAVHNVLYLEPTAKLVVDIILEII